MCDPRRIETSAVRSREVYDANDPWFWNEMKNRHTKKPLQSS